MQMVDAFVERFAGLVQVLGRATVRVRVVLQPVEGEVDEGFAEKAVEVGIRVLDGGGVAQVVEGALVVTPVESHGGPCRQPIRCCRGRGRRATRCLPVRKRHRTKTVVDVDGWSSLVEIRALWYDIRLPARIIADIR